MTGKSRWDSWHVPAASLGGWFGVSAQDPLPTLFPDPSGWGGVSCTNIASAAFAQVRECTSDLLPMALAGPGFRSRRETAKFASLHRGHAGLADKGFAPSGVLAARRLRSEQSQVLQRQWLTYRPGVRPTVAATRT